MIANTTLVAHPEISILGEAQNIQTSLEKIYDHAGTVVYDFEVTSEEQRIPKPITLQWKVPAVNVKGVWKPTTDFNKRIQADWELDNMESRISIDSPVISLFGNSDENILTFACSNAINKLEMNARLREEDNCFYCHITFFMEQHYPLKNFKTQIRIDNQNQHFSDSLRAVSSWWETFEQLKPAYVPDIAKKPLYSTWYQFHQNLEIPLLLEECRLAKDLGYEAIIIDDGWQTFDSNRGYDYTGDWKPDRIPEMAEFVKNVHETGMKVALWYSVPFCGEKSKAFKRFKGKFLTEDHRWAPVFDPRYPDVRQYLIDIYTNAAKDWNLDGFKLDFIDDFRFYKDTPTKLGADADYASINGAVDRLLTDVKDALTKINPEIFIEFRQKYTGPAMRKYGNMFRAFDCPGDATMNRLRIADIRMLAGNTAVHSDMVTWHADEPLEIAALQVINTLFGVPQLSVMLSETPKKYVNMIGFYTKYWNENSDVLMNGDFIPSKPLANYPTKRVSKNGKIIIGVYDTWVIELNDEHYHIDILNGQIADQVVIRNTKDLGGYRCKIYDCQGSLIKEDIVLFSKGVFEISVPPCGIVRAKKL
ncbi:glycoside hydrolase family 36 protein [Zobellia uliginosa]|uniref:glycoside hydrolase family 36 protein n=1 Tax=Zobellia uliginosa TaxID=143224 RepID=UPI001C067BB2|nr:glycoside hydrolase family 36 protein [Zobellia uliginosa]MBU2948583.1 alpha-galactosidase [Zobellia uliginosa]